MVCDSVVSDLLHLLHCCSGGLLILPHRSTILAVISYTMLVSIMHTAGPLLARSPLYGNPTPGAAHLAQAGFLVASLGGLGIWIGLGGISRYVCF